MEDKEGKVLARYADKAQWVQKNLKPMLLSLDVGITDVEYVNQATYRELDIYPGSLELMDKTCLGEWVILRYGVYTKGVNVSADSFIGILTDVVKEIS